MGAFFVVDAFEEANESAGFDGTYDLAIRVTGLPVWQAEEGEERMLLVGFSYARRLNITDPVRFATRPESTLAPIVADTGLIVNADNLDRGGVEVAWSDGRLTVQSEIVYSRVNRRTLKRLEFWGGYAQASWLLSDDRRHYGRRAGAFGRIVPRRRFSPGNGHWGAFELAARLSGLDLDDDAVHGGRVIDATFGVSWFPYTRVRLAANYVLSHRLGEGTANIFQARLQLDY
jgi:phosphate-selective porin OprO/OprP